jgi:hypothetical protein
MVVAFDSVGVVCQYIVDNSFTISEPLSMTVDRLILTL